MEKTTVLFIGDSITDYNIYFSIIDACLTLSGDKDKYELINAGLAGETISGLSDDVPYRRSCIFDRLERLLDSVNPDIAIVMYGANDGQYTAYNENIAEKYKLGIIKMCDTLHSRGMKAYICTPTVFDAQSYTAKFGDSSKPYDSTNIYAKYNEVMNAYAVWTLSEGRKYADKTVNVFAAMSQHISELRAACPDFKSGDGIHPNYIASFAIADAIIKDCFNNCSNAMQYIENKPFKRLYSLIERKDRMLHRYLIECVGHFNRYKYPVPSNARLHKLMDVMNKKIDAQLIKTKAALNI